MELFAEHPEIPYGIIMLLMGIVSFFFKRELNKVDSSIKDLKESDERLRTEVTHIKGNYLNRFDSLKDHITEKHEELLDKISDIRTMVASQSTFCKSIQDQKKQ